MIYQLLWFTASVVSLIFNIFWFLCNVASAGIPWFTLLLLIICIASKFIKLRTPDEKHLLNLFSGNCSNSYLETDLSYWPIANRAAGYDAPENSKIAIEKCLTRGYRHILIDAGLSACGEVVIVNGMTLERAGLTGGITKHNVEEMKKINISKLHPLGSQFEAEYILTLTELFVLLKQNNLTIFLYISDNSTHMIEKLKLIIKENAQFTERIILVTRSPLTIYQLRKIYPQLICGLWTTKSISLAILKTSTLFTSIYGAIFRNIISPVIGISVVFINKDEFNLHVGDLWRNVGVRPIAYNVNSPNEKRYFQKTMKTQYLTDSLRSEPHILMNA